MPLYESVAKMPIHEQAAEIDRRCKEEYEKRVASGKPLTPAHIQMVCGISRQTYSEWLRGVSNMRVQGGFVHPEPGDNLRKSAEEQAAIMERREVLMIWEGVCSAMLADVATDANSKSGVTGANFLLERALGYQREATIEAANASMGLEKLLARLQIRLETRDNKAAEIGAAAVISLPPEPALDVEQDETEEDTE